MTFPTNVQSVSPLKLLTHRCTLQVLLLLLSLSCATVGCAHPRPRSSRAPVPPPTNPPPRPAPTPVSPGSFVEQGVASWYGVPYHGRRAANGEIYDMYKLTAAHRTLPFESVVRVTNLENGRKIEVRITDRGPFVDDRVIDLSLAAARDLDMVASGVVPVRLDLVAAVSPLAGRFALQVGAFQNRENAVQLRDRLAKRFPPVSIREYDSPNGMLYRVFAGRVLDEAGARQLAEQLRREEGLSSFIIRLDD